MEQSPMLYIWMEHMHLSAQVETPNGRVSFHEFGTIPYLYKVLDVAKMLSIQVHPRRKCCKGFALEDALGIALQLPTEIINVKITNQNNGSIK
jgi:mannose-6-phosphate isomerase class I